MFNIGNRKKETQYIDKRQIIILLNNSHYFFIYYYVSSLVFFSYDTNQNQFTK